MVNNAVCVSIIVTVESLGSVSLLGISAVIHVCNDYFWVDKVCYKGYLCNNATREAITMAAHIISM